MIMIEVNSNTEKNDRGFRLPFVCLVIAFALSILVAGCTAQKDDVGSSSLPEKDLTGHGSSDTRQAAGEPKPPQEASSGSLKSNDIEENGIKGNGIDGSGDVAEQTMRDNAVLDSSTASGGASVQSEQQAGGSVNVQSSVGQLRESALQALGKGQDDLAFQLVRQAMRLEPENPQVIFLFAMVLGDRHRYAEAIQMLQELSSREPTTRLPVLGQTAEWMVESGRYEDAEQQFRSILMEVPDALMVHHRLGQLLLQTGRRTEAALHFDYLAQFGELDHEELRTLLVRSQTFPGDNGVTRFDPLNNLAMCRQEVADGKASEVMALIVAAGEDSSDAEVALLNRLRAEDGSFDGVQQWIGTLDMSSAGPDAWYARGCAALDRVSLAEAVACFCQTLLLDQTDVDAYKMLSRALKEQGESEIAKAVAARAALVEETRNLGVGLVGDKAKDRERITQLAQALMKLKRPMEAFGWQTIGLVHAVEAAAITDTQAQATFESIGRQRNQIVKSGQHRPDPAFVLCGLPPNVLNPVLEKSAE